VASYRDAVLNTANLVAYWTTDEAAAAVIQGDGAGSIILNPAGDYPLTPGAGASEPIRVASLVAGEPGGFARRYVSAVGGGWQASGDYHSGTIPNPSLFQEQSEFTIEFIKKDNTPNQPHAIMTIGLVRLGLYQIDQTKLYMQMGNGASAAWTQLTPLLDGLEHHFVISYRNTTGNEDDREAFLWIDGVLQTIEILQFTASVFSGSTIDFGRFQGNYGGDITLDEIAIYSRVLTQNEINAHVAALVPVPVNQPPSILSESDITQGNGTRLVGTGGLYFSGDDIHLSVAALEPDGDAWRAEFEVKSVDEPFDGLGVYQVPSAAYGSAAVKTLVKSAANIKLDAFLRGALDLSRFHWRVRAKDENGNTSAWMAFGRNPSGDGTAD
jgi:hypothetical protein